MLGEGTEGLDTDSEEPTHRLRGVADDDREVSPVKRSVGRGLGRQGGHQESGLGGDESGSG